MDQAHYLAGYDYNLGLRDAFDDRDLEPARRVLAGRSFATTLDDGYFAVAELREAVSLLVADRDAGVDDGDGVGAERLGQVLDGAGDDYQRALWYTLSDGDLGEALAHLVWLEAVMRGRAAMYRVTSAAGAETAALPAPAGRYDPDRGVAPHAL